MKGTRTGAAVLAVATGLFLHSIVFCNPALSQTTVQTAPTTAGQWTRVFSGTTMNLNAVFGGASGAVAVGAGGVLTHFDGLEWRLEFTPTTLPLYGVWAVSPGAVFAVGASGNIYRYNAGGVTKMLSGTYVTLRGVWGRWYDDVYAVGDNGTILHFDGVKWTRELTGTVYGLLGVSGSRSGSVFAAGQNGTVLTYDDGEDAWVRMETGTSYNLNAVWVRNPRDVFAVGNGGTVLRYDGEDWYLMDTPTMSNLNGVWGTSADRVFAAGDNGTMLAFDGEDWSLFRLETALKLNAIRNGFVVGDGGVVFQNAQLYPEVQNLRITEVDPVTGDVEVTNTGPAFVTGTHPFIHRDDASSVIPDGTEFLSGEIKVFFVDRLDGRDSDLWLYRTVPFSSGENVVHGVKYGDKENVGKTPLAAEYGKWPSADAYTPAPPLRTTVAYDGHGYDPKDWYVDETPTMGEPDFTKPGVVDPWLRYPMGTQDFEELYLGDGVIAIDGWELESTSAVEGIFTAITIDDVDGDQNTPNTSSRWVRLRDQDPRDVVNRVFTPVIETQGELLYSWSFLVNLEEATIPSGRKPRLMVQHEYDTGVHDARFEDAWGIEFGADYVYLVVDVGEERRKTVLYDVESPRGVGDWVEIDLRVDLLDGYVDAVVDDVAAGQLPFELDEGFMPGSFRLSYNGGGAGNTGTILLDDVTVDVPIAEPFYFAYVLAEETGGGAAVTWDGVAVDPLAGFRVYRSAGSEPADSLISGPDLLPADTHGYVDTTLVDSVDVYYYAVGAVGVDGNEVRSESVQLTIGVQNAVAVTNIQAYVNNRSVYVGWRVEGQSEVTGFKLYRRVDGGAVKTISGGALLPPNTRSFHDVYVESWNTYYYVVAAVRSDGAEILSPDEVVRVRTAEFELSNGHPNPFTISTTVTFSLPQTGRVTLNVYDVRGALVATVENGVRQEGVHHASWNGRDRRGNRVSGGTYFIRLETPTTALTRKVLLIR